MKAVIVEDEISSARSLARICREIGGIDLVARLDSVDETVRWFSNNPDPDILFLDIHLADGSAFEIFDKITIKCPIIFTTAYDQYALRAFRVNGISYLMKPLRAEDVQAALRKLDMIRSGAGVQPALNELLQELRQKAKYKSHLLVNLRGQKLQPLKVEEIACISIADGLVKAHTCREKTYLPGRIDG
jgi:DNA-binding LytR/AlgR family response regulator